jgi:hypothetical protein
MKDYLAPVGGRRFLAVMATLLGMTLLRWFEHLSNEALVTILTWSVCVYIGGDTWQRHQETKADVQKTIGQIEPPKQ